MDKFEKRWIRREFNKTNGMIFLYKILFGQLTFLIMMAMYRLFPVDEHFNDGAVWYLISGFLCLGIFVIWRRPSFFRTQIFPVHSHMSPGISQLFRDFYDRTERFFRSLCTYGNGSTALRFYICAFSGSCYGRLCYDLYASLLRICCSADRGIHFPRCCFKDIGAFRQVVRTFGSSLAFALMHGNFAQIPFAMAAGLILGYIAMEYSIWYSLLLHISNNLILGDVLPRIAGIMPGNSGNILYNVITNLLVILGIVLLLRKYRSIPRICSSESHNTGKLLFLYFTSVFGILFTLSCIWSGFAGISPL